MGRFNNPNQFSKAETPFHSLLDAYKVRSAAQQRNELDLDKASNTLATTKLEYSKILGNLRGEEYKTAKQLMDNYLNESVASVNKYGITSAGTLGNSSNFLARPEFQTMLKASEYKNNLVKLLSTQQANGNQTNMYADEILKQSSYDENLKENKYSTQKFNASTGKIETVEVAIEQLQVQQQADQAKAMNDWIGKIPEDSYETGFKQADMIGYLSNQKVTGVSSAKAKNIAEQTFEGYYTSPEGLQQIKNYTEHSINNSNPINISAAKARMKNDFFAQARKQISSKVDSQQLVDQQFQRDTELAKAAIKARGKADEKTNEKIATEDRLPYLNSLTTVGGKTDNGIDWFGMSMNKVDIPIQMSSFKSNKEYNQVPTGEILTLSDDQDDATFKKSSDKINGKHTSNAVIYQFVSGEQKGKILGFDNKSNNYTAQGNINDIKTETANNSFYGKPYIVNKKGEKQYLEKKGVKVIETKEHTYFETLTDKRESLLTLGGNYSGTNFVQPRGDGTVTVDADTRQKQKVFQTILNQIPKDVPKDKYTSYLKSQILSDKKTTLYDVYNKLQEMFQLNKYVESPSDIASQMALQIANEVLEQDVKDKILNNLPEVGKLKQTNEGETETISGGSNNYKENKDEAE